MPKKIIPIPADAATIANGVITIKNNSVTKATLKYSDINKVVKTAAAAASAASQTATVASTMAAGEKFRITLQDTLYQGQGSRESFEYISVAGDTVTLVAAALAAKIDASARFTGSNSSGVITAAVTATGGQLITTVYTNSAAGTFALTSYTAGVAAVGKAANMTAEGMTATEQAGLGTVTHVYSIDMPDSIYKVYAESAAVTNIDTLTDTVVDDTSDATIKATVDAILDKQ